MYRNITYLDCLLCVLVYEINFNVYMCPKPFFLLVLSPTPASVGSEVHKRIAGQ